MEDVYLSLNNLFHQWGENVYKEVKIKERYLENMIQYQHFQLKSQQDFFRTRSQHKFNWLKYSRALLKKKEQIYKSGDTSKFGIPQSKINEIGRQRLLKEPDLAYSLMMTGETHKMIDLREKYAFFNS